MISFDFKVCTRLALLLLVLTCTATVFATDIDADIGGLANQAETPVHESPLISPAPRLEDCLKQQSSIQGSQEHAESCWAPQKAVVEEQPAPAIPLPPPTDAAKPPQKNFALGKDGAKVVASNKEAKKVGALLDDDQDTYMRNDCQDDKWVIIELSQVVKVNTIQLDQYELYSSRVKSFEIYGRMSSPQNIDSTSVQSFKDLVAAEITQWKLMGSFNGTKAKGSQTFTIDQSSSWVRFVLLHFSSHHGSEHVCAVNGIAILGRSAAEELEDQLADDVLAIDEHSSPDVSDIEQQQQDQALQEGDVSSGGSTTPQPDDTAAAATIDGNKIVASLTGGASSTPSVSATDVVAAVATGSTPSSSPSAALVVVPSTAPAGECPPGETCSDNKSSTATGPVLPQAPPLDATTGAPAAVDGTTGSTGPAVAANGDITTTTIDTTTPVDSSNSNGLNPPSSSTTNATDAAVVEPPAPPPTAQQQQQASEMDSFEDLAIPRSKTGGSVYEILVQEIKTTKAQQKLMAKTVEGLQRNLTYAINAITQNGNGISPTSVIGKELAALIDKQVGILAEQVSELRRSVRGATVREHAALLLVSMMLGLQLAGSARFGNRQHVEAKKVLIGLSIANGVVAIVLYIVRGTGLFF